jgi:tetratricopeptide (TPR) repeat protein
MGFAMSKKIRFYAIISMVAAFLAYVPVLTAEFVWDDHTVQKSQVPYLKKLVDAIVPPAEAGEWPISYYRPVVVLSYMLDDRLNNALLGDPGMRMDGRDIPSRAHIPHAMTLLFHLLATGAVVWFSALCLRGRENADLGVLAAGLLFALHPVHSESIAFTAGRSDSLALLFLLLCFIAALYAREGRKYGLQLASAVLFFLALCSKEVALVGFALLPLCFWLVESRPREDASETSGFAGSLWSTMVLYAVSAVAYTMLRGVAKTDAGIDIPPDFGLAAMQMSSALGFYIRKIFVPWPITPFVGYLPGALHTLIFVSVGMLAFAVASYCFLRKSDQQKEKLYLFCVFWFVIGCLPALSVAIKNVAVTSVAERYLYLPSVAFALAGGGVATILAKGRHRASVVAAAGALLAVYAATSWAAASVWHDDLTFMTALTQQEASARHPFSWSNLGHVYVKLGRIEDAERVYRRALEPDILPINRYRAKAYNGLGDISLHRAEEATQKDDLTGTISLLRDAETYFSKAVELDPGWWPFRKNAALMRLQLIIIEREMLGKDDPELLEKANLDIQEALRLAPGNPEVTDLIDVYRKLGGKAVFK